MAFRDLHYGELPLVLPNVWDVPSAPYADLEARLVGYEQRSTRMILAHARVA
jgi:2-methylisocitrate lyase-like PEP mutase family enzyme